MVHFMVPGKYMINRGRRYQKCQKSSPVALRCDQSPPVALRCQANWEGARYIYIHIMCKKVSKVPRIVANEVSGPLISRLCSWSVSIFDRKCPDRFFFGAGEWACGRSSVLCFPLFR